MKYVYIYIYIYDKVTNLCPDNVTLRPRLLNQEKGGLIIYTWNDFSEDVKVKAENITILLPVAKSL